MQVKRAQLNITTVSYSKFGEPSAHIQKVLIVFYSPSKKKIVKKVKKIIINIQYIDWDQEGRKIQEK